MTIVNKTNNTSHNSPDDSSSQQSVSQMSNLIDPHTVDSTDVSHNEDTYNTDHSTGGALDRSVVEAMEHLIVNESSNHTTSSSEFSKNTSEIIAPCSSLNVPLFPHKHLAALEDKIANCRWVIPVLPEQEFEIVLDAAIELCRAGEDSRSEACQRFFQKSLSLCIEKMIVDDTVSNYKHNIHQCIFSNCLRIIELCVLKLSEDNVQFLDYLNLLLNPCTKFHMANAMRLSGSIPPGSTYPNDYLYARPFMDNRNARGWLVDMINKFGELGGFDLLLKRFQTKENLTIQIVYLLLRPFGPCSELLTRHAIETYFIPIVDMIPDILENITDEELKRQAKNESKNDNVSTIIKACRRLVSKVPNEEEKIREFEMFRLKMLLRLLQISSFNGKMNALNEVNKLISDIYYFSPRHSKYIHDTEEWITSERMAQWIKNNHVLEIVLRDSLHQPQYVEKLEKILRFVIKENALTIEDLDALWAAQCGKHEAIVKNVHDLLAKLAWDFSPEQLDHLFSCFQASWSSANKKQSENLLELIRRLAEDDKDGVMANKVLILFWNLAHREDVLPDILDQALVAHVKILDYSCSQERNSQKIYWLDRCLSELKENNNWVVPALKLIREICNLYESASHSQPRGQLYCRQDMLERLEDQYSVVALVTQSLVSYVESVRKVLIDNPNLDPNNYYPDKRYNHNQQIQERLNFLHFLLKESLVCLYCSQAKLIWQCLVENSLFISDRELCFKWFSKIMAERPEMDPKAYKEFFESNIMQFDPTLLTESGMRCFERFFKAVNCKDGKMKPRRRRIYTNNSELIGTDYLWRVLANTVDAIANRAIELLTEVYTSLGMRLTCSIYDFHETHISECIHRLRAHYDTITALCSPHSEFQFDELVKMQIQKESLKMCRIIKVLWGYISEYDYNYKNERKYLPLSSCSFSKKTKSHGNNFKLDFYSNGEVLKPFFDKRLVFEYAPSMTSTPDTSSDDDSLGNNFDGMVTNKGEDLLPGVIMSRDPQIVQFFFQIADKGIEIQDSNLRDSARNILETIPPDKATMDQLYILFSSSNADEVSKDAQKLSNAREMFFCRSPSQVLYNLKVLHAILLSSTELTGEKAVDFEYVFVCSKDVVVCYEMLTKSDFLLNADIETKRAAYIMVFKICKLVLYTIGCFIFRGVILDKESVLYPYFKQFKDIEYIAAALKQLFYSIVNQYPGSALCTGASKITQRLIEELADMIGCSPSVIIDDLKWKIPTIETIRAMMKIAWACAGGNTHLLLENQDTQKFHELLLINRPVFSDIVLCREAVEALSISMILNRHALLNLTMEDDWATFVIDVILLAHSECVRTHTSEELHIIYTNMPVCPPLLKCITMLFDLLNDKVVIQNAQNTREYFQLLSRLLGYIQSTGKLLPNTEDLLQAEVDWLKNLKNQVLTSGDSVIEDTLVTGHLSIMKELISSVSSEVKYRYGSDESANINMIKELMEDFLFPSSKALTRVAKSEDFLTENVIPLCRTPNATEVAFDILVIFCKECLPNLRLLIDIMYNLFYSESNIIPEWDYLPPIGLRGPNSFVGLKNAGATCYMNSVLQQLFMIDNIRVNILAVEGAATDIDEDLSGEEPLFKYRVKTLPTALPAGVIGTTDNVSSTIETTENNDKVPEESRKDYHVNILKQIQAIFGHLTYSKLQYYVPRGLWRYFRLHGEIVNLREQQDAVEFFMSLIDCIDEALKTLNYEQIMSKTLVGSYSDQKICRECPHRYYKEEPFSVLSVDIRNQSNLLDSLEQYVKGELLEGVDAYHCDKCDKKVVTMKRLCVKKLPPVLTIQLKRFEYDYERVCAIKYNDYFEFPRYIDMEPYTVSGLAKAEGEQIDCDDNDQDSNGSSVYNDSNEDYENPTEVNNAGEKKKLPNDPCTKYQLTGVIVHSGQAAGGHYYSFIKCRLSDGSSRWFKFDDGDVSECRMDEDEEMKNQCFGGDYVVEDFDEMLKRLSYRKQKRWWNAYMLFYTRLDHSDGSLVNQFQNNSHSLDGVGCDKLKMPKAIEISIRRLNIKYTHLQNQFCQEFFHFIRRVCVCNNPPSLPTDNSPLATSFEDYSYLVTQLLARFLFAIGFRTKKIVRGAASEWCELLLYHIRAFRSVRIWFTINILLAHPNRFEEYILISPISEVRNAFVKLISTLANTSLEDAPPDEDDFPSGVSYNPTMSLSDHIIVRVLELLNGDICEYVRHVSNFFSFFYMYMQSRAQRIQLLKLNVPVLFMMLITDECPAPILKYQPNEFLKCHFTVSTLVRSCSVKSRCCSATSLTWEDYYSIRVVEDDKIQDSQQFEKNNDQVMPNPYSEYLDGEELMPLPPLVADTLYNRFIYLKKVMLESQGNEDIVKLIQFICWENPFITKKILLELLYYLNDMYLLELKHITDFIVAVLQMEDSWQIPKIFHTLNGMGDERDGIFEIFNSHRLNQTKRSYFCVKLLVELFSVSQVARNLLHSNLEMKINVWYAVHWLKDQVSFYNRTFMGSPEYSFLWSPGHPENYPLERSNSAKKIVEKGFEIVPDSCIPVQYLTAAKRFEECADDSCEVEQPRTNEQQLARSDSCNTEGFVSWYGSKQRDETSSTFTEDPFTLIYQPLDNPQEGHTVRKARMKKSSFYNVITKSAQDISREYNMSRKIENQPEADSPNVVENTDEIAEAVLAISASSTSLDDILPIDTGNEAETNSTQPPATTIENDE